MPESDFPLVERLLVPAAPARLDGELSPSPYNFLFTGEDSLRLTSFNALAGVQLAMQGRMWSPERGITPFGFTHVPNTDRTARSELFSIGTGFLLNLAVFVSAGSPIVGQTFVRVQVMRGSTGATYVLGTLVQGYAIATQDLAWPGSPIRSSHDTAGYPRFVEGATVPVGSELTETVPAGANWELLAVQFELTTSAAAGGRWVHLVVSDGGTNLIVVSSINHGQGANNSWKHYFARGAVLDAGVSSDALLTALPGPVTLRPGQALKSFTQNLAAGDQYGRPHMLLIERLEAAL